MKKDHAVSAVIKAWFQNKSLRYIETEGYRCTG